jgi:hypothetical protein
MSVTLSGVGGTFSCPEGTHKKVEPYDVTLGRIKLTLQQVRRQEHGLERRYPSHRAPGPAVDKYNALRHRDHRLVAAFNAEVDARNALLKRDCSSQ